VSAPTRTLPLAEHVLEAELALGDSFGEELAREAAAFLDAHDTLREVRSGRYVTRLQDYLRMTKPVVTHFEGPA
jgi:hypothetical protein